MLFVVTGAGGSGKSTSIAGLKARLPEFKVIDFDSISALPEYNDWQAKGWRQRATEYWLQQVVRNQVEGYHSIICGGAVLGEILACPSAPQVNGIKVCLLDCYDVERIDRLRQRNPDDSYHISMDMLCWAAWLRMHAVDPQWRQDVIRANSASEMHWERWENWQRGDPRWQTWVLDTTHLTVDEVSDRLVDWINTSLSQEL